MLKYILMVAAVCAPAARAEVYSLTLKQAVEQALKQNPEIALAFLDERKVSQTVRIAKDPFTPRIAVGSGLAYSNGFPMSIEGSAPSVVQAQAMQFLFNRQQSYAVAQAKEDARGAGIVVAGKKDEVAFRTALLYLEAERAGRLAEMARKDAASQEKLLSAVESRVKEGRDLRLAGMQAAANLARARLALENLESDQFAAETSLAIALGYTADDRVQPVVEERPAPVIPASEDAAVKAAIESDKQTRRLESQIVAKTLEIRGDRSSRLPRIDLVAQYGLFARFNHYEDFFRRFQRHNGQLGISIQLPVLTGPGVSAKTASSEAEIAQLRIQIRNARDKAIVETRQAWRDIHKAETAREVARLDLDVAREQLSVLLAQMQEGRIGLRQVEEARVAESQKWIAFYDAQYAVEKAQWMLLRKTGDLLAALR